MDFDKKQTTIKTKTNKFMDEKKLVVDKNQVKNDSKNKKKIESNIIYRDRFNKIPIATGMVSAIFVLIFIGVSLISRIFDKNIVLQEKELETFLTEDISYENMTDLGGFPTKDGWVKQIAVEDGKLYHRSINYQTSDFSEPFVEITGEKMYDLANNDRIGNMDSPGIVTGVGGFPTKNGYVRQLLVKGGNIFYRDASYIKRDFSQDFIKVSTDSKYFKTTIRKGETDKQAGEITGIAGFPTKNGLTRQMLVRGGRIWYRDVNYNTDDFSQNFQEMGQDNKAYTQTGTGLLTGFSGYVTRDNKVMQVVIRGGKYYQREVDYINNNFKSNFELFDPYLSLSSVVELSNRVPSIARLGIGSIKNLDLSQDGINNMGVGWYHNWISSIDNPKVDRLEAPIEYMDYYSLIGGYRPDQCSRLYDYEKERVYIDRETKAISNLEDGTIVWVGNEIGWDDKRDPATYAKEYEKCYRFVKNINPSLKVAVGANPGTMSMKYSSGKIEGWEINSMKDKWSPEKRINYFQYLHYVKEEYLANFGKELPVDAFVIHMYPCMAGKCYDLDFVKSEISYFREKFMKGEKAKLPLIIKEMNGVVISSTAWKDLYTNNRQGEFFETQTREMKKLLDFMLNLKDERLGNPNDGNRMVQRWAWFNGPGGCKNYLENKNVCPDNTWPVLYFCNVPDPNKTHLTDCSVSQYITPFGETWFDYVSNVLKNYDYIPPALPTVSKELRDDLGKYIFTIKAKDNGQINTYMISVGTSAGDDDVRSWYEIGPNGVYKAKASWIRGRYLNVKARDDGYNESEVFSIKVD